MLFLSEAVVMLHPKGDQLDHIRWAASVTGLPFFDGAPGNVESRAERDL